MVKPPRPPGDTHFPALPSRPDLTLRDQFAMAALTGLLANSIAWEQVLSHEPMKTNAEIAYQMADHMLRERGQ